MKLDEPRKVFGTSRSVPISFSIPIPFWGAWPRSPTPHLFLIAIRCFAGNPYLGVPRSRNCATSFCNQNNSIFDKPGYAPRLLLTSPNKSPSYAADIQLLVWYSCILCPPGLDSWSSSAPCTGPSLDPSRKSSTAAANMASCMETIESIKLTWHLSCIFWHKYLWHVNVCP